MKKYLFCVLSVLTLLLSCCFSSPLIAHTIPDRPIDSTVMDDVGYLSHETVDAIDRLNEQWAKSDQQLQVGVYITDNLPTDIESLANETFRKWQIGFSGTNNGVLLVIAIEARKFRIETSDNAATLLPDIKAKQILENSKEFFRESDYDRGVTFIVESIGDAFFGTNMGQEQLTQFREENQKEKEDDDSFSFFLFCAIIIFIFVIGNKGGGNGGSGNLLWFLLGSSSNWGSSSSDSHWSGNSGSSGGSGWSGGGGGGGGASSGW